MDTTNLNKENIMPKLNSSGISIFLSVGVLILAFFMYLIFFDVNLSFKNTSKSKQQVTSEILIIVSFSLLLVGLCILLVPKFQDLKTLFEQISNVTYFIIFTIFTILFYTLSSKQFLSNYSYIINPAMMFFGGVLFYKSISENYVDNFNLNYERIKMLIMLFCFITIMITFYNINPGNFVDKYFGYSSLITILLTVFMFLYTVLLMTYSTQDKNPSTNLLNKFSPFSSYGSLIFLLFLIFNAGLLAYNKDDLFKNKEKSAGVLILLLLISILSSVIIGSSSFGDNVNSNTLGFIKKSIMALFGLVIAGLFIYWVVYNIENLSNKSGITSFVLNLMLILVVMGLLYKTFIVKLPSGNTKKNAFFSLLINILFYIPCILSNGFDWAGKMVAGEYNAAEAGSFMMLIVALCLFIIYFKGPTVFNMINTQGGTQLVNNPVNTNMIYNLGNYQDLNGSDTFDYQYALSCWVYVDSAPPNTNPSYNNYTSLLNFGEKPNILYNAQKNTLMITMQQKDLKNITKNKLVDFDDKGNRIIYEKKDFLLQKWNNIIINYNGGTMDIFLNGELVKSSQEVVPYYTYDSLTIGENDGINGGICNVVYFRKALNASNLYYVYNTVKNRTPPVLNESQETIMVKNIK